MDSGQGKIYLVPFFEGDWVRYIPSPQRATPPTPKECAVFARRCQASFRRTAALTGGRFVVGVHTSPAFRDTSWTPPLRDTWLAAAEAGATIALHPHEEHLWLTHRRWIVAHWRRVIMDATGRLDAIGIRPKAFRSGRGLLSRSMLPILEGAGLFLDFSPSPGRVHSSGSRMWPGGWASARRFCLQDPKHLRCGHRRSQILGIPQGAVRLGPGKGWRYLINEHCNLPTLRDIWGRLCQEAKKLARPRCVNFIWCGYGLDRPGSVDQALSFLEYVLETGGFIPKPADLLHLFPEGGPRERKTRRG